MTRLCVPSWTWRRRCLTLAQIRKAIRDESRPTMGNIPVLACIRQFNVRRRNRGSVVISIADEPASFPHSVQEVLLL